MFPDDVQALAAQVLDAARRRGISIATAESCTGGLVAGALTAIPRSSDVVIGGVVSYANQAKMALLGVDNGLLQRHGAVSASVARAMATGALKALGADLSVAITGVAGPGGGTADKPVGLVYFATALQGHGETARRESFGDIGRDAVRLASLKVALEMLQDRLSDGG